MALSSRSLWCPRAGMGTQVDSLCGVTQGIRGAGRNPHCGELTVAELVSGENCVWLQSSAFLPSSRTLRPL